MADTTPKRPQVHASLHYATLLREIKNLTEKLDCLVNTIPTIVRKELQDHSDRNCLAIYGLPENKDQVKKVNSIFALGSLRPPHFTILHRLGKPRLDGLPRPLKIKIHTFLPRLIDLSVKLKADSLIFV